MFKLIPVYLSLILVTCPVCALPKNSADPINIFVSILPQKYLVERVGGSRVNVSVMVKPGVSPETYEPTPRQMAQLQETRLYFRIGVPFESVWMKRLQSLYPDMGVINCCDELLIDETVHHNHTGDEHHSINDAHVWTSPGNAIILAGIIRDALSKVDAGSQDHYRNNFVSLKSDLASLDAEIKNEMEDIRIPYFIVSHPSWGHYARAYGLKQISIEQHGTEIRARELANLVRFARQWKINTVFVQKQFSTASATTLAREINGSTVELDPLAEDYINNLRNVTRAISASMR